MISAALRENCARTVPGFVVNTLSVAGTYRQERPALYLRENNCFEGLRSKSRDESFNNNGRNRSPPSLAFNIALVTHMVNIAKEFSQRKDGNVVGTGGHLHGGWMRKISTIPAMLS